MEPSQHSQNKHLPYYPPEIYPRHIPYSRFPPSHTEFHPTHISFDPENCPPIKLQENQVKLQQLELHHFQREPLNLEMIKIRNQQEMMDRKTEEWYWSIRVLYNKPPVNHQAIYFDPSAAPMTTSSEYSRVTEYEKDKTRSKRYKEIPIGKINELNYEQEDKNPFIVFRNRRIKKKYKKFLSKSEIKLIDDQDSENNESEMGISNSNKLSSCSLGQLKKGDHRKQGKVVELATRLVIKPVLDMNLSIVDGIQIHGRVYNDQL